MKYALILALSLLTLPSQSSETDRKWCGRHCGWGSGTEPSPDRATNCKRLNLCKVVS